MKGLLPEEIRTNWKNRGIQSADWIQRLQEFMDMPESMRQKYVEKHKKDKAELNFMSEFLSSSPLSKIFDFYLF